MYHWVTGDRFDGQKAAVCAMRDLGWGAQNSLMVLERILGRGVGVHCFFFSGATVGVGVNIPLIPGLVIICVCVCGCQLRN